jgi:CheY-like chemotaxis protein
MTPVPFRPCDTVSHQTVRFATPDLLESCGVTGGFRSWLAEPAHPLATCDVHYSVCCAQSLVALTKMRTRVDPVGRMLLRSGDLTEESLADVLDHQRHALPFASLCYVLGHADEEALTQALSRQTGIPGIVIDRSVIRLDVLAGFPVEQALRFCVLPVFEDERRVFVAAANPARSREIFRDLEFERGKAVAQHIALHVTLSRTIRQAYRAHQRGQTWLRGVFTETDADTDFENGKIYVVSDVDTIPADPNTSRAHDVLVGDITKEILEDDLLQIIGSDQLDARTPESEGYAAYDDVEYDSISVMTGSTSVSSTVSEIQIGPEDSVRSIVNLDEGDGLSYVAEHSGPRRVLIVDDDFASRHLLVKVLQPSGYSTTTASSGGEAIRMIQSSPPDLIVMDVMLPEIDGFQVCRAVKRSRRYGAIPVVLMSAVIDSGRVTDDVLQQYGADAYFEKPLNTERVERRIADLLGGIAQATRAAAETSFERSLTLYRNGQVDEAMELLRQGIGQDPLSAKHHFVLANLLQKKARFYEAIDEYEATVDLKPDYFPALTRLAYLYYKKGFSARAIETWRRSLPHCPDPALRQNIEVFMRKLIAGMQSEL